MQWVFIDHKIVRFIILLSNYYVTETIIKTTI